MCFVITLVTCTGVVGSRSVLAYLFTADAEVRGCCWLLIWLFLVCLHCVATSHAGTNVVVPRGINTCRDGTCEAAAPARALATTSFTNPHSFHQSTLFSPQVVAHTATVLPILAAALLGDAVLATLAGAPQLVVLFWVLWGGCNGHCWHLYTCWVLAISLCFFSLFICTHVSPSLFITVAYHYPSMSIPKTHSPKNTLSQTPQYVHSSRHPTTRHNKMFLRFPYNRHNRYQQH